MYFLDLSFEYRYRVTLFFSLAVFLMLSSTVLLHQDQSNVVPRIQLPNPAAEMRAHFHLDLNQDLASIQPLATPHQLVGGLDLDVYTAIQQAQNRLFDMVAFEGKQVILIDFEIPANIEPAEVDRFITYQALNYAFVLSRLMPGELTDLKVKAFRRGVTVDYQEYRVWYDLKALQAMEGQSFKRAYRQMNPQIKKTF